MQIGNRLTTTATGDGLGNLAGRQAVQIATSVRDDGTPVILPTSYLEPASRISLSAEALLFLGRVKRAPEKLPALTQDEWSNKLSPQLAAREYQAFGKHIESGNYQAYYRAFIDYYDTLRTEDQNSLRYFGTRDAAVAGLRSIEYETGPNDGAGELKSLVSVFLDADKSYAGTPAETVAPATTGFGWDTVNISYEDPDTVASPISGIDKLYAEAF